MKKMKTGIVLTGLVLLGFFFGTQQEAIKTLLRDPLYAFRGVTAETISAGKLKKQLGQKNFTLINVHTPYEGEIEKTDTFVAFDKLVENSASLPKDKNAPIILYCKTGRMSGEAVETMRKLGYTNVRHLAGGMDAWQKSSGKLLDLSGLESEVLPAQGIELPVSWGNLGKRLVELGVINLAEFRKVVKMTPEQEKILTEGSEEKIKIDATNSQFIVDMLWAIGLSQKSLVYTEGPMGKEHKDRVANFASTGGWSLASGDAVNYLNRFDLVLLTPDQQAKVAEIAKNIYRPCCGNSTWFPDCNHGMAALAIIELLVANNIDEATIYKKVLGFNSFWFANNYLYVATHFARQGISWDKVDAKEVLGATYSSGKGAAEIAKKVGSLPYKPEQKGGSCGA